MDDLVKHDGFELLDNCQKNQWHSKYHDITEHRWISNFTVFSVQNVYLIFQTIIYVSIIIGVSYTIGREYGCGKIDI